MLQGKWKYMWNQWDAREDYWEQWAQRKARKWQDLAHQLIRSLCSQMLSLTDETVDTQIWGISHPSLSSISFSSLPPSQVISITSQDFPSGKVIKNPPADAGDAGDVGLIPGLGRSRGVKITAHSSILAWKPRGQRSLACCSPWGCKELDKPKQLTHTHTLTCHVLFVLWAGGQWEEQESSWWNPYI